MLTDPIMHYLNITVHILFYLLITMLIFSYFPIYIVPPLASVSEGFFLQ